jgi:hypothetical protein
MPCLNEAETISKCIRKAQTVFASFFLSVLGLRRRRAVSFAESTGV